jgi:hypothetical protein
MAGFVAYVSEEPIGVFYEQKLADPALMRVRLNIVEPTLRVDSTAPRMPLIR